MTMKRNTKAKHQAVLASGQTPTFQSPTIIARLGRKEMTVAEYREHRMGRRQATNSAYVGWIDSRLSQRTRQTRVK
jgi:hypothetical protein